MLTEQDGEVLKELGGMNADFLGKLRSEIDSVKESNCKNKCKGIFGKLFGHKFEPRYDEKVYANHDPTLRYDERVYVQEVCVRCGAIRNRKEK